MSAFTDALNNFVKTASASPALQQAGVTLLGGLGTSMQTAPTAVAHAKQVAASMQRASLKGNYAAVSHYAEGIVDIVDVPADIAAAAELVQELADQTPPNPKLDKAIDSLMSVISNDAVVGNSLIRQLQNATAKLGG